jgi:hypothetical protein
MKGEFHNSRESVHMLRKLLLVALLAVCPAVAYAHLCNDVFAQARDNLVVKVDVRDGQLRIGQEGSFRVYLLNTMDREITAIDLQVASAQFNAQVQPSPDWRDYPLLKTSLSGGRKQYFTVNLRRKPGVPDGRYRIDLQLSNPNNRQQVFKTVDIDSAAALCPLPPAPHVAVDGLADQTEWGQSALCTNFYVYKKKGDFYENEVVQSQARFRVAMDAQNIYALLQFQGGEQATSDVGTVYVSPETEAKPMVFNFDRISGRLTSDGPTEGIEYALSPDKTVVECKIPRALLRPAGQERDPAGYHMNFTRTATIGGTQYVTYWRGNPRSVMDPIAYGYFTIVSPQPPVQ